jgi:Domain of Unknown Function (DUF1080)
MFRHVLTFALAALVSSAAFAQTSTPQLTAEEKAAGWRMLFDGVSTKGWRGLGKTDFPKQGWRVEEGELQLVKENGKTGGGNIITEDLYSDFELTCEWKISPGGNSGIKYNLPNPAKDVGCEYQVLDDGKNHDATLHEGTRTAASLYDVIAPSADKKINPVGEWNQTRIVVQGNHVEHWLNGVKVVAFDFGSDDLKAKIAESKFKTVAGWGVKTKSPILLQDHGDAVSFRNMKIKETPAN